MAMVSWLAFWSTLSDDSIQCWTWPRSWPNVSPVAIQPHLRHAGLPPLAAHPWENWVQDRRLDIYVIHGLAQGYLGPFTPVADLPSRQSVGTNRLVVPNSRLPTVSGRAFPVAGPQTWNDLPEDVTSAESLTTFRHLKTQLFRKSSWLLAGHQLTVSGGPSSSPAT